MSPLVLFLSGVAPGMPLDGHFNGENEFLKFMKCQGVHRNFQTKPGRASGMILEVWIVLTGLQAI